MQLQPLQAWIINFYACKVKTECFSLTAHLLIQLTLQFWNKKERSFTVLFVDGRFPVNVDTLICDIKKQKKRECENYFNCR